MAKRKRYDTGEGNLDMIKNSVTAIKHHAEELTKELKKNPEIEAWVLAKTDRAAQNLSDVTHYLDGETNKYALGGRMVKVVGGPDELLRYINTTVKDRSERDSIRIAKEYQKVIDSRFDNKVYENYDKLVKETEIPKEDLRKIEHYVNTTPQEKRRDIDIYRYWSLNDLSKGWEGKSMPNDDKRDMIKRFPKFADGGMMERYTVNVYYGGEMEDEVFYTDNLFEAKKISQQGEHSEIYDNVKKVFIEEEYADGGEVDEEDYLDYNSISDLQSERNRLVRWKYQYNSNGADYKIKQLEERIEYLKSKEKMADGGMMAKVGTILDLQDVYSELRSKVGRLRINEETKDNIDCDIRDWGNWEHDYEDYDRDEEDFEDDDSMILSDESYNIMKKIVDEVRAKYPDAKINWGTSEKNYIDFQISRKMAKGGKLTDDEFVQEAVNHLNYNGYAKVESDGEGGWLVSYLDEDYDYIDVKYDSQGVVNLALDKRFMADENDREEDEYAKGGKVKERVYIDYLNKLKGFQKDRKYFDSYEEALIWARTHFDKFDTDYIKYEYAKGGQISDWSNFVKENRGYFEIEEEEDGMIHLNTRENGSIGDEQYGEEDLQYARYIIKKVKEKFPKTKARLYDVDEWIDLELTFVPDESMKDIDEKEYYSEFTKYLIKNWAIQKMTDSGWKFDYGNLDGTISWYKGDLRIIATPFWDNKEQITIDVLSEDDDILLQDNILFKPTYDLKEDEKRYMLLVEPIMLQFTDKMDKVYARGGKVKFQDKADSIAASLVGKKVPSKYRKQYGAKYDQSEAEMAGKRIAGAIVKKYGM